MALVQRRPTSCRGSVLSKSRGGEKVKQTFNAASHEPQSGGGFQGDAVSADSGVRMTRLGDAALRILDGPLGNPVATTSLPRPRQGTRIPGALLSVSPRPLSGAAPLLREHTHLETSLFGFLSRRPSLAPVCGPPPEVSGQ